MKQAEIEQMLIGIVRDLQELSGREATEISAATRPIEDIPGFDSLNCVEATIDAASKLNREIKSINIFYEDDKALSIKEVATCLLIDISK